MKKTTYLALTKSEEKKILDAQSEKMRKDPEYARKIARKAGILDKNGELTAYYKEKA